MVVDNSSSGGRDEGMRTLMTETLSIPGVAFIKMPANMSPMKRLQYIYNVLILKYPEEES